MTAKKHYWVFAILLIIVVCANLLNVSSVRADGEPPTEPPAATEAATEPPVESTPAPVQATEAPATEVPATEALTQVPEGTEVVVLDEGGNSVPLATQEAAEIVGAIDPMWCPAGVLPGGAGCSASFATITALVNNMGSNTAFYTHDGIIYFTSTITEPLTLTTTKLTGGDFDTLNDFNLTLQGGWNGTSGAGAAFSGQTTFGNNEITIGTSANRWAGNITLNDIAFSGGNATSLTIYTTAGNITLSNVDVIDQGNTNNTALLDTNSGNIIVQNGSTFDGNNSSSLGFSAKTGSGSISISDTAFTENARPGPTNFANGATLSAPVATLSNVTSTGNDGSGVFFTGSRLILVGGNFSNNLKYGVEVAVPATTSIYIRSNPTCTGNTSGCYNDTTVFDNTAPAISPNVTGTAGTNGWYKSNVSVSWTVTDAESGILSSTGCGTSNLNANTTGTSVTCSASNNAGLSNSASVTIKIDKTAPVLSLPANITTPATGPSGATVTYSATATDNFDSSVTANCAPASGSTFSIGTTPVSCSSTDAAGNLAAGSFQVTVQNTGTSTATVTVTATSTVTSTSTVTVTATPPVVTSTPAPPDSTSEAPASGSSTTGSSTGSSNSQSNSSAFVIPLTGGELIHLDCNNTFWEFGIRLSFMNLCNHDTTVKSIGSGDLPGKLPNGFTYVMGLDLSVLMGGQTVEELPNGTGVQIDFSISDGTEEQFAVLYWDGTKWIEISQSISSAEIAQALNGNSGNELYQLQSATDVFYEILTTNKTGIFVLVKK